jgi:hypothetical protein
MSQVIISIRPPPATAPARFLLAPVPPTIPTQRFVGFEAPCGLCYQNIESLDSIQKGILFTVGDRSISRITFHFSDVASPRTVLTRDDFGRAPTVTSQTALSGPIGDGQARSEHVAVGRYDGFDARTSYVGYVFGDLVDGAGSMARWVPARTGTRPSDGARSTGDRLGVVDRPTRSNEHHLVRIAFSVAEPLHFRIGTATVYLGSFDGPTWISARGAPSRATAAVHFFR